MDQVLVIRSSLDSGIRLQSTRQRYVRLIGGFARDCSYGQEQTCKQPVQTRGRNTEYNIGGEAHQKVAQEKSQHNSPARSAGLVWRKAIGKIGQDSLQPVKVEIGNGATKRYAQHHTPSVERPRG